MGNPAVYGLRRYYNIMGAVPSGATMAQIGNDASDTCSIVGACTVYTTQKFYWRDSGLYIYSSTDGQLDMVADTTIALSGAVTMDSSLTCTFGAGEKLIITSTQTGTDPGRVLYINSTSSAVGSGKQLQGMQIRASWSGTSDSTGGGITGAEIKARASSTSITNTLGTAIGIIGNVDAKKATFTTGRAIQGVIDIAAGGTITTAVGLRAYMNNSGTATNSYAIIVEAESAGKWTYGLHFDSNTTTHIYCSDDHLKIKTGTATKNVRINSQTYTTDASIIGLQVKPRGGVALTHRIAGIEVSPGINDTYSGTTVSGIISNPLLKGTTGNLTGEIRAFEGKCESDTGSTRTVTGPVSILKADQAMHGTVTNGVFVIHATAGGGNVAWSGFAYLPDDAQIADSDGGSTADGWIKVKIGTQTTYIPTYNTAH